THAPQPVSSQRQAATRRAAHARHIATTPTPPHRVHVRRHRAAPRHHFVVRRHLRAPAVPALPVLAPLPPKHDQAPAASSHHGGIHHSLAMPLPLSDRGLLIGL